MILTTIHNVTMKPVHDITLHPHHLLGMDPNPPSSQEEACTAKSNQQFDPKTSHLQSKIYATSKAEYTNTQQGLSVFGYT